MSYQFLFSLVEYGHLYIPMIIVAFFLFFTKTWLLKNRILCGVVLSWLLLILFTVSIYNPLGILAGYESGVLFPEAKFDTNVGIILFMGWINPFFMAGLIYLVLKVFKPSYLLVQNKPHKLPKFTPRASWLRGRRVF